MMAHAVDSTLDLVWDNVPRTWVPMNHHNNIVQLFPATHQEVEQVRTSISVSAPSLAVTEVLRIQNPILWSKYLVSQERLKNQSLLNSVTILDLYHGTNMDRAMDIAKNGFNWRKCLVGKFGRGVSFSPCAWYAHFYPKQLPGERVLIQADVAIGTSVDGTENMTLPPEQAYSNVPADTSHNGGKKVYVKYFDDEAYPKFVVKYCCLHHSVHY